MNHIEPIMYQWGYGPSLLMAMQWMHNWGWWWCLLIASIFPIPYKLFAIIVGASKVNVFMFILMSAFVRFLHFALIPLCFIFFKDNLIKWFHKKVD